MATECRGKRTSKRKLKQEITMILLMFTLFGGLVGFLVGRSQAEVKTETVTVVETVEVPAYVSDELPESEEPYYYDVPLSHSLQKFMYEICADENVPMTLVLAMIEHESGFNAEAVSSTNDYGLMQINSVNHEMLEEKYQSADMLNAYQNVFCGVKILGGYVAKYEGDYTKALMAYNMGEYGAKKAWSNGITSTTYSDTILELCEKYESMG